MDRKTKRLLELLDNQIVECVACTLFHNGRCKPYWTPESKYAMVLEAPGKTEIEENIPVIGTAGRHLWDMAEYFGYKREDFLIINSVNCRPVVGNKNGKPTYFQTELCRVWVRKYLKVFKPEKMIIFGAYALFTLLNKNGIMKESGSVEFDEEFDTPIAKSIHPAMIIYNKTRGKQMLYDGFQAFKEINV